MLDSHVTQRLGTSAVLVSDFIDSPDATRAENDERFHREVSLMWSLSFHPNVVSLVAYTEEPRTIITRQYISDMSQFLHESGDREQLEGHMLAHMAAGITSGVNAIHSMQVAHRELCAFNVLIQAPAAGERFPTPVIAGFGSAIA